jgi:hypothetical protein
MNPPPSAFQPNRPNSSSRAPAPLSIYLTLSARWARFVNAVALSLVRALSLYLLGPACRHLPTRVHAPAAQCLAGPTR